MRNLIILFLMLSCSLALNATRHYVKNTNDSGAESLRDIIANASSGDTVFIDVSGVLFIQSQIQLNTDIVIIGPGPAHFSIDGTNLVTPLTTGFVVYGNQSVFMEGIKFTNFTRDPVATGNAFTGTFEVSKCLFEFNETTININGGNMEFESCSFINNYSAHQIFSEANSKFTNCTFYYNDGGTIISNNGTCEITHCTFFENGISLPQGKALLVQDGAVTLRNNIFFNDSQGDNLIDIIGAGTISSLGGNITNDMNGNGDLPQGSDIASISINVGFSFSDMVTDGWGLKYFPIQDPLADAVDIDNNPTGLTTFDQRRVWRVMDAGSGNEFVDAGAVEYTPLVVTQAGGSSPGTLEDNFLNVYSSLVGKKAFVFEISGIGPHYCPSGFVPFDLTSQETIINGFSQNGSRVPGPGTSASNVTPGITSIVVNNAQGIPMTGFTVSANNCVIAGVSVVDFSFGGKGIENNAYFTEISGCHIGVTENGTSITANEIGIEIGEFGSTKIGSGNYCGHLYHSNRNIISGNTNTQIAVNGGEEQDIKHNFIGLASDGISAPIGSSAFGDTGISFRPHISINNPNFVGGYDATDYNVIGGNDYGIVISTEGNFVLNNVIGGTLTGDAISNATENYEGIRLEGSGATNNLIGDAGAGNVIIGNYVGVLFSNGANNNEVYGNNIGVSIYGDIALGNFYEGVSIQDAGTSGNKIGGPGKGNVISNNDKGIWIANGATSNVVLDNLVGLSGDGLENNMGNLTLGIEVEGFGTDNNIIGSPGAGNFISFNGGYGIRLRTNQFHTIIQGNIIGLKTDTLTAAGNSSNGVYIDGDASHNLIGGCSLGEGNFIGNNGGNGIQFDRSGADYDTIYGNKIGLDVDFGNAGNIGEGILITGGAGFLTIGNSSTGCGNEIAYNNSGVTMDNQTTSVLISSNSIHDNIGLGIDIDADGTPDYTVADGLTGNEATPIGTVSNCIHCSGNTNFTITPETSGVLTYEVFKADGAGQEGDSLVYTWTGTVNFGADEVISMPFLLSTGMQLVMTATIGSSTSEFGSMFTVSGPPAALTPSISNSSICVGSSTPTLSTTGEVGTPVWFADAGLSIYIATGNNYTLPPSFASVPSSYTFYVVDSVAGCYGTVSSPVSLSVIDAPLRPISGSTSVCEGVISEIYSVTPVSGATYAWNFATELPGEYSFNNNITYTGSSGNQLTADFFSANNSGVNDTLIVSVDSAGCISNDSIFIGVLEAPFIEPPGFTDPTTCGGSDGQIIFPSGLGTFDFYYNSGTVANVTANGSGDSFILGFPQGTYSFDSVSNAAGCYAYLSEVITLTDPLPPTIAGVTQFDPTSCGGNGIVVIYLTPGSAAGPYTVDLDGGTTIIGSIMNNGDSLVVGGLIDGQIILNPQVTDDATLCLDVFSYSGTISDPLPPLADAGVDQTVCDAQNVTFSGLPTGGGYTYGWNFGDGGTGSNQNENYTYGAVGVYTATLSVTETITGCIGTSNINITVTPSPFANADTDITICEGSGPVTLNGMISNAAGGTWTSSGTGSFADPNILNTVYTPSAFDESNGLVTLTLTTTGNGICVAGSDQVDIIINPLPNEGNPFITDVTCFGGSDGAIMIAPFGSYSFTWTGPNGFTSPNQDISGLEAGNYTLSMTDADGCVGVYNTLVNEPTAITPNATTADAFCFGSADGTMSASAFGGAGGYTYNWYLDAGLTSVYSTSNPVTSVPANTYYLQVTDGNGCQKDTMVTVNQPPQIILSPSVTSNYNGFEISCAGNSDGELDVVVSGGVSPYVFDWNDGVTTVSTTQTATNLPAGNYNINVTDVNGCFQTSSINLFEPTAVSVNANSTDVTCFGFSDGTAEAIPNGGTGAFTIDWYNDPYITWFSSANPVNNLSPGAYYVEAIDANGCVAQFGPISINEPTELLASFGSTHETCVGNNDGTLFVQNVSGGSTGVSYTVNWQTNPGGVPVGVGDSITNISFGVYLGEVTDANGCFVNGIVDVQPGETFFPFITVGYTDSCVNSNSFEFESISNPPSGLGSITWNFANATPSTSSNSLVSGVLFNTAGNQTVIANYTSSNGCVFDTTFSVQIYDTAALDIQTIDITCFGFQDGEILASAVGGTSPYQYSFNSGGFSVINSWSNLNAGTYTLQLQDNAGCIGSVQNLIITEPTEITYDTLVTDISCGLNNGSAEVINVNGGAGTVSFEWFEDSDLLISLGVSNPITNLTSQTYYFVGTDANGCQVFGEATVGVAFIPVPTIDQGTILAICEDPTGSTYPVLSATSNGTTTGTFTWYIGSLSGITSIGNTLDLDNSNVANHYIYLTEENGGCVSEADSIELQLESYDATFEFNPTFCLGDAVQINGAGSGDILWYETINGSISDSTTFSPILTPSSENSVYYIYIGTNNCLFYDSIVLTADPNCDNTVITVNAFSPDGDGVNDNFILDIPSLLVEENTVTIVNRWGDEIQKYQNYNNNDIVWDGRNKNGEFVTDGTYFYIIEIPSLDIKQTGWIQVVR